MSNINNEELMELTGGNSDYPVFEGEVTCPYCKITQRDNMEENVLKKLIIIVEPVNVKVAAAQTFFIQEKICI